jgi:hypothetical protein
MEPEEELSKYPRVTPPVVAVHRELIRFRGHPQVRATHVRTIELTTEDYLTPNGDCIVGVEADKSVADLSEGFRIGIRSGAPITFTISVGVESFSFRAVGDPRLELSSSKEMVIRRSEYACGRTLAVRADAASIDIPRTIISSLRSSATLGSLLMEVDDE